MDRPRQPFFRKSMPKNDRVNDTSVSQTGVNYPRGSIGQLGSVEGIRLTKRNYFKIFLRVRMKMEVKRIGEHAIKRIEMTLTSKTKNNEKWR